MWRPFRANAIPRPPGADLSTPDGDLYNFQPVNYDITPSRRISLFTQANLKIHEAVHAFFEGSYVNRESVLQLAPEPLIIGAGGAPARISANSFYNPFGRDFTTYSKRLTEFGPRTYEASVDTFRVVTGLNGTIISTWVWDLSLNYGRTQWAQVDRGHLQGNRLQNAVGPSFRDATGVVRCGTPGNIIDGCVPLDLFHGNGAITSAQAAYLSFPLVARISNELTAAQANFSGELPFTLLSDRPVGLAVGYEFRYEKGADIPDPVSAAGESTGNNREETRGAFHVHEGYGELSLPILSGMPGAENLEGTAAIRVFNYNTFGTDVTYKFGARWSIIKDVTLRGTYSTAFRAPSITDLYQGASDNFPSVTDPCASFTTTSPQRAQCRAQGVPEGGHGATEETQLRSRNGGSPTLQPETAKTFTAGIVLEPRYVRGLSVVLDYYWIKIDNAIQPLGAQYILNQCFLAGDTRQCPKITRDSSGFIDRIDDLNANVGGTKTAGMDLGIRYTLPTEVGRFIFGFDGTWLQSYNVTQPDGKVVRGKGVYDVGILLGNGIGGVYPTFKALGSLFWNFREFGAGVTERFVGSFQECPNASGLGGGGLCSDNPTMLARTISAYYQTDISATYQLKIAKSSTTFQAGVRNLFNSAPPRIFNSFTPISDSTGYDFMGRFFYGRVTQTF
jgi:outer membrane receptor protein involved in Fe transport